MNSQKSAIYISFWIGITLFFSYLYSYPSEIIGDLRVSQIHTDHVPSVWAFQWRLLHLAGGQFSQLFTGNLFFPLDSSILFNVNPLSSAFLSLPVYWATGDFFYCYKVAIFSSFVLASLGMFLLARQLGLDFVASFLASIIFAFNDYREIVSSSSHLVAMQWMPFTLLFIHRYFEKKSPVCLHWSALFYSLEATASETYFILFSLFTLVFVIILGIQNSVFGSKKFYRDAAFPFLLALIPTAYNYLPYFEISREFGFNRSIATQAYYGLPIFAFLSVPDIGVFQYLNEWFGKTEVESYHPPNTSLLLTFAAVFILRKNASHLSWIRKFDFVLIFTVLLTLVIWQYRLAISEEALRRFPFLYDNPTVVPTAILSPLFILLALRICFSKVARRFYEGLRPHKTLFIYTSLAIFTLLVSMGPVIKTYDQNYLMANPLGIFLYFTFPGFSAIRAISRMSGLIPLATGITAAISFSMLRNMIDSKTKRDVFTILVLVLILFEAFPVKGMNKPYKSEVPNTPAEYEWLKNNSKGPALEYPTPCFICDVNYMRWATYHMKPLVNGWGSYQWDGHKKINAMKDLSTPKSLRSLDAFGIRYLVIHQENGNFPAWAQERIGEFYLVEKFNTALIYENVNAKPQFLPEHFWEKLSVSHSSVGDNLWQIKLIFVSPEKHYVSVNKIVLPIEIIFEDGSRKYQEFVIYPTLWENEDSYSKTINFKDSKIATVRVGISTTDTKKS